MPFSSLLSALESLLFMSGSPLTFTALSKILETEVDTVVQAAQTLGEKYLADTQSGLMVIINDNKIELATKPENAAWVEALTKSALQEKLSKTALEVLSIIAYRAPITRHEIDTIRGVNCSFTIRNLLLRDLIERVGDPGDVRGYVYRPTFHFLESIGIAHIRALPDYDVLSRDHRLTALLEEETRVEASDEEQPTTSLA
ncbi:MAG: SMC-Scp complex subunit ScpB [Minisyncoccota bacterium]